MSDKDIYGGLDPEKLADQAALAEAEKHHVEVTKPEGFADNEFAVRYTDDKDQEQDIVATRNPDRAGKDDEFDFWAPHKDPNTGKYTVKADIGNDILTLGINLYARKFYAKWYAEQKQAEAARQQGNPEQAVAGLEKEAEKWARENAELKNQLGQQEQKQAPEPQPEVQNQAPQVGAVPGQRSSVDERLDRIERNQQIMMEKLNRIEENQRSFFDKLMQRVGNGLEMLGSGLEKLGNMLDRTGDNLLITSGRIQAGFDRLTGQENFAEYPSRPQAPQQGAGNGDDALHKKIAELEAEIKKLREENTRLKEQLEQQKQQSKNPETRNEDKAPELADPAETAAMEKTSGKQEQKRAEAKTETRNEDKAPEPASDEEKLQNKAPELADPAETAAVEKTPGKQEQKRAEAKTDRTDKTVETKHPGQGMRGQGSGTAAPAEQPEQASQNTNELARELANRVKPLADVSLVEDADLQRVLNSPVLITPRAFCVAYIDTALRMGEVNKDVHAIVKDAGNALSHCLTLNAMGCVCTGIKGKDKIAFPMDHFDLSGNNIKDESIRIVVQRMSWGVLKKGDLRVAEFRKAVAASANKEITRAFNQGKNYQQAVKDTFNKVLKETRQEAAEAIKNRADFISNSDIRSGFIDKDGSIKSFAVLKDHDTAARFGLAKENVR